MICNPLHLELPSAETIKLLNPRPYHRLAVRDTSALFKKRQPLINYTSTHPTSSVKTVHYHFHAIAIY